MTLSQPPTISQPWGLLPSIAAVSGALYLLRATRRPQPWFLGAPIATTTMWILDAFLEFHEAVLLPKARDGLTEIFVASLVLLQLAVVALVLAAVGANESQLPRVTVHRAHGPCPRPREEGPRRRPEVFRTGADPPDPPAQTSFERWVSAAPT